MSSVSGVSRSITRGANDGRRSRRASPCSGGSDVMGGADSTGPSPGRRPVTPTLTDEYDAVSLVTATRSAYDTGSHWPPQRSVWATGQRSRSSAYTPNGSSTKPGSKMSKSVAQSPTGSCSMPSP